MSNITNDKINDERMDLMADIKDNYKFSADIIEDIVKELAELNKYLGWIERDCKKLFKSYNIPSAEEQDNE